ncbi:MAG: redoxin domain-containing protein [Desulfobacteraceae bacterium]|nr:redoxin domain-containing protein [Desulfobacteraceae bacterium]MCF8036667.1 redoxin domain-containing protein [Desulfobacteraceae bacterium]
MELEALEAAYQQIKDAGASLIMISPQSAEASRRFAEKNGLTMELLVDSANQAAAKYGLVYTVPDDLKKVYQQFGIHVDKNNDDGSWDLPMSARYIIDTDRTIFYAQVSADYTVRPDPAHTIEALKDMKASS